MILEYFSTDLPFIIRRVGDAQVAHEDSTANTVLLFKKPMIKDFVSIQILYILTPGWQLGNTQPIVWSIWLRPIHFQSLIVKIPGMKW